ncbi:hypothetical protein [Streptomyces sp. NRRL S-118]|uniref:hypothetical protein n=1 Tax=Streptomyces sp. NRRL S-118 TaxID=1463881 RepID=UPI0004CA1E0A|nr:hypothetical protein [Streptomyces sp. NRRL S-118]
MQREDMPGPVGRRLSTEDLARPRDTGTDEDTAMTEPGPETGRGAAPDPEPGHGPEPGPGLGSRAEPDVPTFPGDSTPTATGGEPVTTGGSATAEPAAPAGRTEPGRQGDAPQDAPRLLAAADQDRFRESWQSIQNEFVDDPREAVHKADALVADVMQQLATNFASHKKELEGQWNRGEEANTEDLRMALRRYRSFFNRLLTT